jgi:uncharacterized membrane protein
MERYQLDQFAGAHRLSAAAVDDALKLAKARPDIGEWRDFGRKAALGAGIASLVAGVIFFVAANWHDFGMTGRFVLLQTAFVIAIALALWRMPPQEPGRSAILVAIMLVGALFALFGQTYQTGADVYELFFTWALFALPLALAGRWRVSWAVWWCVLNVALALLTGTLGPEHFMWTLISGWGTDRTTLLMAACLFNMGGAALLAWLANTAFGRFADLTPSWLNRMLVTFGMLYGTAAALTVVTRSEYRLPEVVRQQSNGFVIFFVFIVVCVTLAALVWRAKRDVFPLALIAAAWIAISTAFIGSRVFEDAGAGALLMLAVWLIGTSTVASLLLMKWIRVWRNVSTSSTAPSPDKGVAS